MKLDEIFRMWEIFGHAYEVSVTKNKEINFYDKEKKLLLTLPVSVFEKIQKVSGGEDVI